MLSANSDSITLRRVLFLLLIGSLLFAALSLVPTIVYAFDSGGGISPEEICSNYDCTPQGGGCEYQGQHGFWEHCCYTPFPYMCQYCPSPCCWDQCNWWD